MEKKDTIGVLGINILYLVTALLLLTVGYYVQSKDIKSGLIITEYILVLLPPLIYIKLKGDSFKRVLRLNKLKGKHILTIVGITIFVYPVALFFNLIVMTVLSTLGKIQPPPIPTANNIGEYFVLMLIIAMSAGICEEVFFRGLVMRGYERFGQVNAIVLSALLFGLFHFNIQNFAGPMILGLVFGFLVYRTDSIFAGIVGHMTNNGIAVTFGFLLNYFNSKLPKPNVEVQNQMSSTMQLIFATIFMGMIAVVAGSIAYFLIRMIIKETKSVSYRINNEVENNVEPKKMSIFIFTPILLTVIIFIYVAYIQLKYIMAA
ncbi:type II CAAX endopeptidase family protein [Crassaminicella profunda]|uniref:type II CAAX endopeptidase family protein n=1 Tax=Crassaminicella profunda TaxID=1286698 RepID=UPI001CA68B6E|nr:type II CAAX endopeptidase family protein [Crassaminicella profunda]QZY56274.1 CPBP family intramembrane metalloprotease [Crassaminicella profunda]